MYLRTNVPFQYTISGNKEQVFLLYYKDFFEQICSDVQFISPPEEVGEFLLHLLKWLIVLYWFLNLLCCLIIARAFHNISLREKRHELLVQQMSFLQKQLEYTTEMEQEYQSVRKWNHDMENHLFSLNYLIRTQKYLEADVYLETILSELPPEKRTL